MADVENAPATESRDGGTNERPGQGRRAAAVLALIGVVIAGVALARDYFDVTSRGADPSASRTAVVAPSTLPALAGGTAAPSGGRSTPAGVHLDTLAVQGGAANLTELPRALAGRPDYQRSITISCPRNTSADKHREVTYPLLRRYVGLTTVIRPYFPDDSQAKAYVSVIASTEQPDGTINRVESGDGKAAGQDAPVRLDADLEKADDLTLRVQCESPTGFVVLTEALLAPR